MCSLPPQPAKGAEARVWIGVAVIGHPSFVTEQCESVYVIKTKLPQVSRESYAIRLLLWACPPLFRG